MKIISNFENGRLELAVSGRLDANTAPELKTALETGLEGVTELVLDFSGLEYVSSAGLRVLLFARKTMNRQGKMVIRHVNDTVREIFDITGFLDILTVE